jgi:hypothetical protein
MTYRVAMEKPRKSSGKGPIVEPKPATMDRPARSRLLDRVRDRIRVKQYTFRHEQAHLDGIKRFIHFHGKRHRPRSRPPSAPKPNFH